MSVIGLISEKYKVETCSDTNIDILADDDSLVSDCDADTVETA